MSESNENSVEIKDPARVLEALHNANEEAKGYRQERDKYKKQIAENPWRKRAIDAEVKSHLTSLGIKDAGRVMKYINTEGLDFDDDGNVVGLQERVDEMKKDFPEVFDAKRRVGGAADAFAGGNPNHQKSASERQAAALLGR